MSAESGYLKHKLMSLEINLCKAKLLDLNTFIDPVGHAK